MNKPSIRIFLYFSGIATLVSITLFVFNLLGVIYFLGDGNFQKNVSNRIFDELQEQFDEKNLHLETMDILPQNTWCILIDKNGDMIWSQNKPHDIDTHYDITDIARMSRWFLKDYPVYLRTTDYGLFILGYPKNSYAKYSIILSAEWFEYAPKRLIAIIVFNLLFSLALITLLGQSFYKKMIQLSNAIYNLQEEKSIRLNERGIFKELDRSINKTSQVIEQKNQALSLKEEARSNWIAGISHDIRTPLAIVLGNAEALVQTGSLSETQLQKINAISQQSLKIKKLIENLNLVSSLEYNMQPLNKKKVRICPLLRRIAGDIINRGLPNNFDIELDLQDENTEVLIDEFLIERAIVNLMDNSIHHNERATIKISAKNNDGYAQITVSDNGKGVAQHILEQIAIIPKTAHGLGLPMSYRIILSHNGRMSFENNNGFTVQIFLPIAN